MLVHDFGKKTINMLPFVVYFHSDTCFIYIYIYLYIYMRITQYIGDNHNTRTLIPIHTRKLYLYEHLRRLCRQILKIDEVTTGASLSTGTSPTTECTNTVKS
jgi:hypothetical protein